MKTETIQVIILEDGRAKEVNPFGIESDEEDFDRYDLPICFEPTEELKELNRRSDRIKADHKKWQEAESKLRTFTIDYSKVDNSKKKLLLNGYIPNSTHSAGLINETTVRIL